MMKWQNWKLWQNWNLWQNGKLWQIEGEAVIHQEIPEYALSWLNREEIFFFVRVLILIGALFCVAGYLISTALRRKKQKTEKKEEQL